GGAGHDGAFTGFGGFQRLVAEIESEPGFAFVAIRAVALVTVLAQNRPDVVVEINFGRLSRGCVSHANRRPWTGIERDNTNPRHKKKPPYPPRSGIARGV